MWLHITYMYVGVGVVYGGLGMWLHITYVGVGVVYGGLHHSALRHLLQKAGGGVPAVNVRKYNFLPGGMGVSAGASQTGTYHRHT